MKRIFTFLMIAALTLGVSQPLMAQEGRLNVKVGAGWLSLPDFMGLLVAGLGSMDSTEGTTNQDFTPLINPNVELVYGVNSWLSLGGSLSVGYASAKSVFEDTGAVNRSSMALYPSLMFAADTRYFSSGKFSMYGSWGVGAMALYSQQLYDGNNNTQFTAALMGNVYPLCFALETADNLSAFLEIGWGAKGVFNLGVKF